jgi:hypothetical protein
VIKKFCFGVGFGQKIGLFSLLLSKLIDVVFPKNGEKNWFN